MQKLSEWKWQILAVGGLLLGLFFARGGLAVLASLLKFILPLVVIVLGAKFIKKKLLGSAAETLRQRMEEAMKQQQQAQSGDNRTIQLCSSCGGYLQPGHKCQN